MPPTIAVTVRSPSSLRLRGRAVGVDVGLERVEREPPFVPHPRPGAERAEHEQRHGLRLGRGQLGERLDRPLQALGRAASPAQWASAIAVPRAPGDVLVGAQQQLFLVGVEAVEGRRRDVRELREVGDPHRRVALARRSARPSPRAAAALVLAHQLGVEPVRARGQAPVALRRSAASSCVLTVRPRGLGGVRSGSACRSSARGPGRSTADRLARCRSPSRSRRAPARPRTLPRAVPGAAIAVSKPRAGGRGHGRELRAPRPREHAPARGAGVAVPARVHGQLPARGGQQRSSGRRPGVPVHGKR